ncbi:MAG TPA: MFS transporter [Steroidobacteraceae bacterium]|nr:MFS transporter [Steroidobacteraceae bacterium]
MIKNYPLPKGKTGSAHFSGGIVLLMALAIFINYVDRGNLATAAPLIKTDLRLSNTQYGILVSAFFWIYVPGQIVAAWFVQKINAYRTLALGLALWSAATIATGFASGFAMLLVLRVLLGLGESAGFPASSKLLAQHLPPDRLGVANALVVSGVFTGPAVGTFVGGLFIAAAGWRPLFIVFGAISLLWLAPWVMRTRALDAKARSDASGGEPKFRELLAKRELWGASIGQFCALYPFYLVLSWLPLYLVKSQGYSLTAMARLGGIVYALSAAICCGAAWLADRSIARGADPGRVRIKIIAAAQCIGFLCMMACGLGNANMAIAGLLASSVAFGLAAFNIYAIGQTLAGPRAAGKWIGIQNGIGNISGIVAPIITGALIDWTGRYQAAFLVAGGMAIVGACSWLFVVRRAAPLGWIGVEPFAAAPTR